MWIPTPGNPGDSDGQLYDLHRGLWHQRFDSDWRCLKKVFQWGSWLNFDKIVGQPGLVIKADFTHAGGLGSIPGTGSWPSLPERIYVWMDL